MIRAVYSDDYMGRSFDLTRYNCWHFVRDVWRDMTGVDLGDLTPPATNRRALEQAAWEATDGPWFERLERPADPCIVLLTRRSHQPHVGVMLRRRLLHLTERGVLYQDLTSVEGFDRVEFYAPRAQPEAA